MLTEHEKRRDQSFNEGMITIFIIGLLGLVGLAYLISGHLPQILH